MEFMVVGDLSVPFTQTSSRQKRISSSSTNTLSARAESRGRQKPFVHFLHFLQHTEDKVTNPAKILSPGSAGTQSEAVAIEGRTNLLFSFEKMALRDAVKPAAGARQFAESLFGLLHGEEPLKDRFATWCAAISGLPRRQTRVLTWPIVTVFGFIAQPRLHFFLKPKVTRKAAEHYGFDLDYESRPQWETYSRFLAFAKTVRADLLDLRPRDMIDIQSFLWVQGSDEYPG
jgi:hypothetical protein